MTRLPLVHRCVTCILVALLFGCDPPRASEPQAPAAPAAKPATAAPPAQATPSPSVASPAQTAPAPDALVVPKLALGSFPPAGAPTEYDQMVAVLRNEMSRLHFPMDMTASSIELRSEWAWLFAQPHQPGTRTGYDEYDEVGALLRKVNGAWTLAEIPCTEPDTPGCMDDPSFDKQLAARLPGVPIDLIPHVKPPPGEPKAMLDAQIGSTRLAIPLDELASSVPLAAGETFKIVELARDEHSSHHVVALLDAEPLHIHATHDLTVVTLVGKGEMTIERQSRPIGPRSIVYIPRGAVHSMRNTTNKPLIGYAMFSPPFDGKDRVLVPQQ